MCTAISFQTSDHYFGRNLDLEYCYNEAVTITPRNYPLPFRMVPDLNSHYAMIGVSTISNGYPLYYDATNEYGLSVAGLNFPGNAVYQPVREELNNLASFELIPWILSQCKTVGEAEILLKDLNVASVHFSDTFQSSPLHWIVADRSKSITVEPLAEGLKVYDNPVGVLTNNPPFDFHIYHLSGYLNLTREDPSRLFAGTVPIEVYSKGLGAVGLPGDLSSSSRFVRAAYTKLYSICNGTEEDSVSQFFHILGSVEQQYGCVRANQAYEKTVYTSCCNTDKGIYYYKTYENSQITAVNLFHEQLDGSQLFYYPLCRIQKIRNEN